MYVFGDVHDLYPGCARFFDLCFGAFTIAQSNPVALAPVALKVNWTL
jgi:hypothetical protein